MYKYLINGQKELKGEVLISGSKNAALPLLAASLLTSGKTMLRNVPELKDIKTMLEVLKFLGVKYLFEKNNLELDTTKLTTHKAPYDLVKTMRASIYVLGPLLARLGKAMVSLPGGCAIGPRPVNLHIDAMEKLGATIKIEDGFIHATTKGLKGTEITFPKISVGATANILMGAVLAKGTTVIKNAALEPEVEELINFLIKMGARIEGKNTDTLTIQGIQKLKPVQYTVIPDRIESGTYLMAGVISESPITIKNMNVDHIRSLIRILEEIGVQLEVSNNSVKIKKISNLKGVYLKTLPYPGFPTDLHPLLTPLLTKIKGISVINETIFENRFAYIPELIRMGAEIEIDDHMVIIKGGSRLNGTKVMASDLRGGAALVLAGLIAKNETIVDRIYHIDRGYENMEDKLQKLGADIKRIKSDQ
ncbi:MAG: UDP-N-acetylglucosamine 1-carboxyvinyltransferase [Spirochaetes bacterium]|nr:UDP-N-acetylglucosamine 1-carboxyvinyltransferase [Spirochaetota bacterium]